MAAALAQAALHLLPEAIQQIQRHESLDGARKSAAVDPAGAPACQGTFSHGKGQPPLPYRKTCKRASIEQHI